MPSTRSQRDSNRVRRGSIPAGFERILSEERNRTPESFLNGKDATKRRKTNGLNSRFDRMIQVVNVMPTPSPTISTRSRTQSTNSGSSSATSYDAPRTPVDAYSRFNSGLLGRESAIIKMISPKPNVDTPFSQCSGSGTSNPADEGNDVPPWLLQTVASLDPKHPLRGLVPVPTVQPSIAPIGNRSPAPEMTSSPFSLHPIEDDVVDQIFAFRAPSRTEHDAHVPDVPSLIYCPREIDKRNQNKCAEGSREQLSRFRLLDRPPVDYLNLQSTSERATLMTPSRPSPVPFRFAESVGSPYSARLDVHDLALGHPYRPPSDSPFSKPGTFASSTSQMHSTVPPLAPALSASSPPPNPDVPVTLTSTADSALPFSVPGPLARQTRQTLLPVLAREHDVRAHLDQRRSPTIIPTLMDRVSEEAFNPRSPTLVSYDTYFAHKTSEITTRTLGSLKTPTHLTRPVYFDSPFEDPIGSDPLEPAEYELDLDYQRIGFHWEKFQYVSSTKRSPPRIALYADILAEDVSNGMEQNLAAPLAIKPFRSALLNSSDPDNSEDERSAMSPSQFVKVVPHVSPPIIDFPSAPSTPEIQGLAFAPIPGIYISPLRGEGADEDQHNDRAECPIDEVNTDEQDRSSQDSAPSYKYEVESTISLPRTPVKQIIPAIPPIPSAPRNAVSTPSSAPPAVAPPAAHDSEDIDESDHEAQHLLSQVSHDTIESWGAAV